MKLLLNLDPRIMTQKCVDAVVLLLTYWICIEPADVCLAADTLRVH